MPVQILMPSLPPASGEGVLNRWLVREGDTVTPGVVIAEIETARATLEIEARAAGTVARILVRAGAANVPAGSPLAELSLPDETLALGDSASAGVTAARETTAGRDTSGDTTLAARNIAPEEFRPVAPSRAPVSPLARRLARELSIDLGSVRGSGPNGRVVKRDVETYAAAASAGARDTTLTPLVPGAAAKGSETVSRFDLVEAGAARGGMVERSTRAASDVPHAFLSIDCRLDELLRTRARLNAMSRIGQADAYRLTINDFIVRAWALALQRVSAANVTFRDGRAWQHQDVDISIAMTIDGSVGVGFAAIRQAQMKSLSEISNEVLRHRTEAGRRKPSGRRFGHSRPHSATPRPSARRCGQAPHAKRGRRRPCRNRAHRTR